MTEKNFPTVTIRGSLWLSITILALDALFMILVSNGVHRAIFSDLIIPFTNLLAVAALFYAARISAQTNPKKARAWYLWMVGWLLYTIASIIWASYELILGEPPFPSVADVFYISFYIFIWLGLAYYPGELSDWREHQLSILDNTIVVVGAGLSFWVFLIKPFIDMDGVTLTTFLELVYPIMGIVSIWSLLIFFRNRMEQSLSIPLLVIGIGFLSEVSADIIFAYEFLNGTFMTGNWSDLFYLSSSLAFMIAAIIHATSEETLTKNGSNTKKTKSESSIINRWPVYLPYFWLAIAYALLIYKLLKDIDNLPFFVTIGLIIGLVIFRQVLTIRENELLYRQADAELEERKQAQEDLRQINLVLDARVEQRTNDLKAANDLLVQYNQRVESSLHEKEVLLKEIHHRVKNNLQIVSSLLNLQTRLVQDAHGRAALQDSQMRIRSMALVHEKLYQSDNLTDIHLGSYLEGLSAFLFRSYQSENGRIQLLTQLEDICVDIDVAVPLGLIMNELISNALKHAFPDDRSGKITIHLWRESLEKINLQCGDDGCGLPLDLDISTSKSLGLQLVRNLVNQLHADMEIKNQFGAQFIIRIPNHLDRSQLGSEEARTH